MRLDHLAIAATSLAEGVAWAEDRLGTTLLPGGKHARFATHNRLLGLHGGLYLEVIAPDPEAICDGPRWFGLDHFSGPPRLANWICAVPDLAAALRDAPEAGIVSMQRGDLRWNMAVPDDGSLPMDGAFPTLLQWHTDTPPGALLPPSGVALAELVVQHPQAAALSAQLSGPLADPRIRFEAAAKPALNARLTTPRGLVDLSPDGIGQKGRWTL